MGPGRAYYGAAGGYDHALRAQEFVKRHPEVSIRATPQDWEASWLELRRGAPDAVARHESRPILGQLMDELEAKFDA